MAEIADSRPRARIGLLRGSVAVRPVRTGSTSRRAAIPRRVFWLLLAVALLSAGVIAGTLLQQRADAIAAGEELGGAFAQLADEQTARTLQIVEQTLQFADVRLAAAVAAGTATEESVRADFRAFLKNAPFLKAIRVLDERGRVAYDSDLGTIGVDLSIRPFFPKHRDNPASAFVIEPPIRNLGTGEWTLPASRALRRPDGTFAGVIVGALDPGFFDQIWTRGRAPDTIVGLFRSDGMMLIRSPLDYRIMGTSFAKRPIFERLQASGDSSTLKLTTRVNGESRTAAYRRLGAYPDYMIGVALSTNRVLGHWWDIVLITVVGWAVIVAAVVGLVTLLAREWKVRHAADERSRMLFEGSPYPIYAIDFETQRFAALNDAAVAQYGWSREEFVGREVDTLYPSEELPAVRASRQEVLRLLEQQGISGATRTFEGLRHRTKSGDLIDVELHVRLIELDGRTASMVMARNVTDRVRAEQARQAAEAEAQETQERYSTLFRANPYPMAAVDRQTGRILAVSNAAVKQYGWSREELLAMHTNDLYPPEELPKIKTIPPDFDLDSLPPIQGFRHRRKDGTIFDVEMILRAIELDGRPAFLATALDVTDRLRAEKARLAAEEQLRQSQKMEAVGQLTGGIAHDFNNILTVIMANIDAVQEEESVDTAVAARLDRVSKAVQRAADLTRQLLAYSRKQPLRPQRTDVNELVTTTGTLLRRSLGAQIEIEAVLADDLSPISIDRTQLETALVNLCVNARDAMPDGGRLLIETRNATLDADYVARHPDAVAGDYVMLSVADTGSGMPPEVAAKAFEPFFTTKETGKGTGLGLSMVYGFVKQSKGHIAVDSEVGRGTTFRLYLPCAKEGQADSVVEQGVKIAGGNERILVVEDEPQVRASVVLQLKGLGYAVTEAPDGAAGVAAFEAADRDGRNAQAAHFDLLLTDVVMPGPLNGKALADEVSRRWPRTKIVFMSGYSNNALAEDGGLTPGVRLLSKPFRRADLASIVRQALDASRVM